jgi:hypothetical protein
LSFHISYNRMMLSRTEKEQRVIELYHQGKTIRKLHRKYMSFADIGAIVRKVKGSDDDKQIKEKDNMPHTSSVSRKYFILVGISKNKTCRS